MLKIIKYLFPLILLWSCTNKKTRLSSDKLYPNLEISIRLASDCISKNTIDPEIPIHIALKNQSLTEILYLKRKDFGLNRYDENGNLVICGSETMVTDQTFVVPANTTRNYILYSPVLICAQSGDSGLIKLDMVKGKMKKPVRIPYLICKQ